MKYVHTHTRMYICNARVHGYMHVYGPMTSNSALENITHFSHGAAQREHPLWCRLCWGKADGGLPGCPSLRNTRWRIRMPQTETSTSNRGGSQNTSLVPRWVGKSKKQNDLDNMIPFTLIRTHNATIHSATIQTKNTHTLDPLLWQQV